MILFMLYCLLVTVVGQQFDRSNHCMDLSPDCTKRHSLCQNTLFEDLMREQCRKTCNYCDDEPDEALIEVPGEEPFIEEPSVEETTPNSFEETEPAIEEPETPEPLPVEITTTRRPIFNKKIEGCSDHSHDCSRKRHLCIRHEYRSLMSKSCAKTCGFCGGIGSSISKGRHISTAFPNPRIHKPHTELVCRDLSFDCSSRIHLCHNRKYLPLMQKVCRKTCNLC